MQTYALPQRKGEELNITRWWWNHHAIWIELCRSWWSSQPPNRGSLSKKTIKCVSYRYGQEPIKYVWLSTCIMIYIMMYTFDTNRGHVSYQLWQQTGVPLRKRGHGQSPPGCSTGGTTVAFAMIHATRQFELLAGDPKVFPIGATWHSVGKIAVLSSDHFAHDYIITVVRDTSILVGSGQVWDELVVS